MQIDIYDPLTEYVNVFRERFKNVTESTFHELAKEANVDVAANRKTCSKYYQTEAKLHFNKSRIGWITLLCVLLWLFVAAGVVVIALKYREQNIKIIEIIAGAVIITVVSLFMFVHPARKKFKDERARLQTDADRLKSEAWEQMKPLNSLYDWDILTRMMTKTVPRLEFDPYFTTQRLADLRTTYGWDDSFNADRSVIYSHSGLINGNPFVLCRTRRMEMVTKTYYGSITISWTERERGTDGKYHTVHRSQVLTASVDALFPEYPEKTRLIYGNTAAPDLIFYRRQNGLAGREKSLSYRCHRHSVRCKARNLSNADFAMMTNEDFEVLFDTSNRNNNQQFALLFTPLAQESMLKLLRDRETGYGDDFDFDKNKKINIIIPNHLQELNLEMSPDIFSHFDFDKSKENFGNISAQYFRAIYFSLAPLLCVPMYQQIRPQEDIYGYNMQRHSAFWEHETLANFWGQDKFKHPRCVTDCILKTEQEQDDVDKSIIRVYAHGYRAESRLTYVNRIGGDGRMHRVPVKWVEYLPVTGCGSIYMSEDNDFSDTSMTQRERQNHISTVLDQTHLSLYRRHIASRL